MLVIKHTVMFSARNALAPVYCTLTCALMKTEAKYIKTLLLSEIENNVSA